MLLRFYTSQLMEKRKEYKKLDGNIIEEDMPEKVLCLPSMYALQCLTGKSG